MNGVIDIIHILGRVGFWGLFVWFIWPLLMLIVTLLTPSQLLKKYFKHPHFNAGELIVFGSFPGFFIRTALFCRLYLTPAAVKGRNLNGFVEDSPKWFRLSTVIATLGLIFHGILSFSFMGLSLLIDS